MRREFVLIALAFVVAFILIAVLISTFTKPKVTPQLSKAPASQTQKIQFRREGVVISDSSINNPEIIKLPDGSFRMFAHRTNQMISAKSEDGKNSTLEAGTRLQGGMPALVTLENNKYRMYFNSFPDNSIKSAISIDGFNFQLEQGIRLAKGPQGSLDQGGIIHPSVLRLSDGTYKMYYDGVSTVSRESGPDSWTVMSASSPDGLIWTKDPGARIPESCDDDENDSKEPDNAPIEEDDCLNGAWNVNARIEDGSIVLYFSGDVDLIQNSGIWKASSEDGLNFTIDGLVLGQEGTFSGRRVESGLGPKGVPQDPFVLATDEGLRLFYWTPEGGILSAN